LKGTQYPIDANKRQNQQTRFQGKMFAIDANSTMSGKGIATPLSVGAEAAGAAYNTAGLLPLEQEFGIQLSFPYKLHKMLELAEDRGYSDIISWLPNGLAFRVHKRDELLRTMVPGFFRQTRYKSFLRQLNMWGFARMVGGAYCHAYFRRDRPELCHHLTRCGKQGTLITNTTLHTVREPNETTRMGLFLLNDLTNALDGSKHQQVAQEDRFLLPRLGLTDPAPAAFRSDDDSLPEDVLFGSLGGGQNAQMSSKQWLEKKYYKTPQKEGITTFTGSQDVAKGRTPLDPLDDGGIPDAAWRSEAYRAKGQALVSSPEARSVVASSQGSSIMEPRSIEDMEPRSIEDMKTDNALPMVPAEDMLAIWPLPFTSV
jgi:HSF-type DNA-binding